MGIYHVQETRIGCDVISCGRWTTLKPADYPHIEAERLGWRQVAGGPYWWCPLCVSRKTGEKPRFLAR